MVDKEGIIFYYTEHHNNTETLLKDSVDERFVLEKIPSNVVDVSQYKYIGFASGVYWGEFGKALNEHMPKLKGVEGKKCFSVCTSGSGNDSYIEIPKRIIKKLKGNFVGGFGCKGFDTYGQYGKMGGIAHGHPSAEDAENCKKFLATLS